MIRLFVCLGSGNCFKPWLAMKQLNIPFELSVVDVLKFAQLRLQVNLLIQKRSLQKQETLLLKLMLKVKKMLNFGASLQSL